jgi:hypothetical protein
MAVFWVAASRSLVEVYQLFRGLYFLHNQGIIIQLLKTSETSVNFYQSTWRCKPEDGHLHTHHGKNHKSYFVNIIYNHLAHTHPDACYMLSHVHKHDLIIRTTMVTPSASSVHVISFAFKY